VTTSHDAFAQAEAESKERYQKLLDIQGDRTVDEIHRDLGLIMWNHVGMARSKPGLEKAIKSIRDLRSQFWERVRVPGAPTHVNSSLEKAGRVADFLEFAEVMANDALTREESCGGHFREEHQTEENEAKRDDEGFQNVSAWEYQGPDKAETLHKEELDFEAVTPGTRSYK
ncbi:MAG: fumarate reductase/succinate dehydrogenase flavoprotein subunit, partial [Planctomycetota bacterium]